MKTLNVDNWWKAPLFFDLPAKPVMKVACGRHEEPLKEFAERWGWQEIETDWKKLVERDDIDIIDISSPQNTHYEIAMAAIENGKHIFCEKPQAMNYKQSKEMYEAAQKAGIKHSSMRARWAGYSTFSASTSSHGSWIPTFPLPGIFERKLPPMVRTVIWDLT